MKERPILFSGPMVRAILEGRKTMTRRVVKDHPSGGWKFDGIYGRITSKHSKRGKFGAFIRCGEGADFPQADIVVCPYGQTGDRLWVRETFRLPSRYDDATPEELAAQVSRSEVRYLADGDVDLNGKTRPGIFLRYGWHRILLEVVSVRVERVRDISETDSKAEGAAMGYDGPYSFAQGFTFRGGFMQLWNSINAKRGYGWDANPWVWVVEFKMLKEWP